MTITPSPAMFAGRKKPTTSPPKSDSSEPSSEAKEKSEHGVRKPFVRKPRLLINHPELEGVMQSLKKNLRNTNKEKN